MLFAQDDVHHPRLAAHIDAGNRFADQFYALDIADRNTAEDIVNALRLGALTLTVNEDIGERVRQAAHMLSIVDGETRHLVDHVQRGNRIESVEIGRFIDQNRTILGAGLSQGRTRKEKCREADGRRLLEQFHN